MFLEKLIEQHCVNGLIPHCVWVPLAISRYQIGIYFFDLLSHESELWDPFGVDVFLVAECDRLERQNYFAGIVHRLDLVFESRRGRQRAEMAIGAYDNRYTVCNSGSAYPSDESSGLSS